MTSRFPLLIAAAVLIGACESRTPEQQMISDAADALGGRDRVLAAKTLVLEGDGVNGNLGQDVTPEATAQTFAISGYRRTIDIPAVRARLEQTRTPNFTYFQGQAPQKQTSGFDGQIAYNVGANGTASRAPDTVARDRRAEFYHHPLTIVRAALGPNAQLSNLRTANNQRVLDVAIADGGSFTLAIDQATNLPSRVVSMTDNTNLGDVAIETSFSEYTDVSGLKLPSHIVTTTDRFPSADIRLSRQTVDGEVGDLQAPASATSAPAVAAVPPANVTVEEVARGVWLLAGQSHHSVVVEFADHLVLIEAPQNDTRALAAIAKARALRPDKPLTTVVNTHHHFDHSGGIRAAVSEGLTVITHEGNQAYFRDSVNRAHTVVPDALAKSPTPITIETVAGEKILKDASMTVNLYHVAGSPHSETMLMAYIPHARLLIEVDVFSPGAAVHPFAANLLENVVSRKLRVDRIVPLHGAIAPYSALLETQAKTAN